MDSLISLNMSKRKPKQVRFQRKNAAADAPVLLYGFHTVKAALNNGQRQLIQLFATQNAANQLADIITARAAALHICTPQELAAKLPDDAVHQGLVLETKPLKQPTLEEICAKAGLLVVLDQLSDPRNVGAILRTAAVFGIGGLLMTRHNSPPAGGALAKTASGALEIVPLIEVANLARAVAQIKQAGYLIVGLDEAGDTPIEAVPRHRQPLACVMGAEGKGLRRLTRENCDMLVRLPVAQTNDGAVFATLNVATASAIALYALK